MDKVITLKNYVKPEDIKHVTFSGEQRTQTFECYACGKLPVIDGVVFHTKPDEDHI